MKSKLSLCFLLLFAWLILIISESTKADISADVRNFTGGRTVMVWEQNQGNNQCCEGTDFILMGLDTDDGKGERIILAEKGNYNNPMLTPDGYRIVYTESIKRYQYYRDKIYIVNFDGTNKRYLKNGYASDVWKDPATGKYWLYYASGGGEWRDDPPIVRCLIDDPDTEELVWSRTNVTHRIFDVSADGTRAAGNFNGNAGIASLPNGSYRAFGAGCENQISPDNQYITWYANRRPKVHRFLCMYYPTGERIDSINVFEYAPGNKGWEVFHQRWSNHIQYFVLDGPFSAGSSGACVSHDCSEYRDYVAEGGYQVEIHIGKFNPGFVGPVTQWCQVTNNSRADLMPDIRINPEPVGIRHAPGTAETFLVLPNMVIQPNPFNASYTIFMNGVFADKSSAPLDLQIYDIQGTQIHNLHILNCKSIRANGIHWDSSRFPAGIYIIKLESENQSVSKTIFKEQ